MRLSTIFLIFDCVSFLLKVIFDDFHQHCPCWLFDCRGNDECGKKDRTKGEEREKPVVSWNVNSASGLECVVHNRTLLLDDAVMREEDWRRGKGREALGSSLSSTDVG